MFMSSESLVVMLLSFINACIIYNSNTAQYHGGRGRILVWLKQVVYSADVCNYTIHSNTVQYNGRGGVRVTSNESGSIDFHNCTCHNTFKGLNTQLLEELLKFLLGFNSYH